MHHPNLIPNPTRLHKEQDDLYREVHIYCSAVNRSILTRSCIALMFSPVLIDCSNPCIVRLSLFHSSMFYMLYTTVMVDASEKSVSLYMIPTCWSVWFDEKYVGCSSAIAAILYRSLLFQGTCSTSQNSSHFLA